MANNNGDPRPNCQSTWLRRQRAETNYPGLRVSLATTKAPPCQQGEMFEAAQITMPALELDKLPEDILNRIHSLVPLRDAAHAACVSRKFLRSWRCFPNFTFNQESLGLNMQGGKSYERAKKLIHRIDHIVQNHSGIGVKTLKLQVCSCHSVITSNHVDIWLQAAVKSGIVEITLGLPRDQRPNTISLEALEVSQCDEVTFLNIPSHLQQLSILKVFMCKSLQAVEVYAPKLSTFSFRGPPVKILVSDPSQLKYMIMHGVFYSGMIHYARTNLHSTASSLQTLTLSSSKEDFGTPMLPEKFLHLRRLNIYCSGIGFQSYDYFSLVSFLVACPVLETFVLPAGEYSNARQDTINQDFNADSLRIRRIPEFRHPNLKKVTIIRFCPVKSLVELTCHIIENTSALRCLMLDTTHGFGPRGMCKSMDKEDVIKALGAVETVKRYIKSKVPPSVKFKVWEPCSQCHLNKL